MTLATIKISQLPKAPSSQPDDLFPIAQDGETMSIEPGQLSTDWRPLGVTPTVISTDGQGQYVIRFANVNYSQVVPLGSKFRIPRTITPQTKSMSFTAASLQYASKVTPTGITFTDDFTCEAWVYVDGYNASTHVIINKRIADAGWTFRLSDAGRVEMVGILSAGNNKIGTSYRSVPIGKWTHVAASLDMSANSASIYIDGELVPSLITPTGTANSLTQSGDLAIGKPSHVSSDYFNGKISNVRVWSGIRSASQIRENKDKENPSDTTGLVAHYKGDGSWNDSSSNLNHLNPFNGALNDFASHKFSAVEYAKAMKVESAGANTDVTIFTGPCVIPFNENLGAVSYSTAATPQGFPADSTKWRIEAIYMTDRTQAGTANTWYNENTVLIVGIGAWRAGYEAILYLARTGTGSGNTKATLSTSATGESNKALTTANAVTWVTSGAGSVATPVNKERPIDLSTPTPLYLNHTNSAGSTAQGFLGSLSPTIIYAECAYQ